MSHMIQDGTDAGAADGIAPAVSAPDMTAGGYVILAGIVVLFVALALALVACQYLAVRRRGVQASPSLRRGAIVVGAGDLGVDPEVLRSLPVTVYRAKDTAFAVECAVCLTEVEDGEEARFLPGCGHGFHAECIDLWLHAHVTCPLCRLTVGKTDVSLAPSLALPPVPPEPASYATTSLPLPVSVMFSGADQGAVTAIPITAGDHSSSTGCTAVLVIEIPELAPAPAPAPDASKTPGSARLRSLGRLWSCGRRGAGSSAGAGADIEQGLGIGIDIGSPRETATPRAA